MKRPPLPVTLIAIVFIIAGISGIVYHASEWKEIGFNLETVWAFVIRVTAIAAGVFVFRGSKIARWILVGWILYHVVLSFYHSTSELITHIAVAVFVLLALFNKKANAYFDEK